jgi:hypothetical protein
MTQSSVIASLKELAHMEAERVRALTEAQDRARRDAAARERAEREAAVQADAAARYEEERRVREEAARVEAVRRAALEAARVDAELRASARERDVARNHELEMERARAAARGRELDLERARAATRRWQVGRTARVGALTALLAAAAAGVLHYGWVAPRQRARDADAAAKIASRDATIADLGTRVEATEARARALEDDLRAAAEERDRLRALHAPRGVETKHAPASVGRAVPTRTTGPVIDGFTTCPPGSHDPLCMH